VVKQRGILTEAGRAMLVYFAVTAVIAGLGGVTQAPNVSSGAWLLATLGLFGYLVRAADRRDSSREGPAGCLVLIVTLVGTAVAAFLGFVVLVNIWMITGLPL
jgi:hypothetical protein